MFQKIQPEIYFEKYKVDEKRKRENAFSLFWRFIRNFAMVSCIIDERKLTVKEDTE